MRWLRDIIESANVLNVLLTLIILAFAASIAVSAFRMRHYYAVPKVKTKGAAAAAAQPAESSPKMPSDYALIGEANLFHPDRTIPVEKKAEVPRPEIVLYGTLVDTDRLAFIEDRRNPVTTPGRGARQRVVKKGEVVSGYTVTDIMSDRITLARGDDRITVMLSEPKRRGGDTAQPAEPQAPPPQAPAPKPGVPARSPQLPQTPPKPAVGPNTPSPAPVPAGGASRPRTGQPAAPQPVPTKSTPE